jgi:hypothetical protein
MTAILARTWQMEKEEKKKSQLGGGQDRNTSMEAKLTWAAVWRASLTESARVFTTFTRGKKRGGQEIAIAEKGQQQHDKQASSNVLRP